jgi:hypothetical protein
VPDVALEVPVQFGTPLRVQLIAPVNPDVDQETDVVPLGATDVGDADTVTTRVPVTAERTNVTPSVGLIVTALSVAESVNVPLDAPVPVADQV